MQDSCVDDNMILHILHRQAAIDDFPLSNCHPVVMHLLQGELVIGMQGLGRLSQHQLQLTQSTPPDTYLHYFVFRDFLFYVAQICNTIPESLAWSLGMRLFRK